MRTAREGWTTLSVAAVLLLAALLGAGSCAPPRSGAREETLVFAAASLQSVLDELAPMIQGATGVVITTAYGASSALSRQIENGAPADLFISADLEWMNYLAARNLIRPDSRLNLLGNQMVLIAAAGSNTSLPITQGFPLAAALGGERLAMAEPASVPAGRYAKAALSSLGVWESVAGQIAAAENARAALMLVSRGETPLGVVYRSDALADRGVRIVDVFPAESHPPVVYPAALTTAASPAAVKVLTYLQGAEAMAVFERHGFSPPPGIPAS